MDQNGRMSKDCERLSETGEAFIYIAMSRPIGRRSARSLRLFRKLLEGRSPKLVECQRRFRSGDSLFALSCALKGLQKGGD